MSAWIVSKAHIDALVSAAGQIDYGAHSSGLSWYHRDQRHEMTYTDTETASAVGAMLWAENLRSINYRYPDTVSDETNIPGPSDFAGHASIDAYTFKRTNRLEPVAILKAIACYEYQTCEHPGWKTSESYAFCDALRHKMIGQLARYDEAPWGLEEDDVRGLVLEWARS